ncbi:unnamed protein product [Gongylonema pulchrum]|uniref:Membralin n=1 Tax=Gongylonema pulchrum TaxID=637853 RepID=A0A183DYN2_9BILA|nr:unnamed protein product [Gongylonema pulchrum]
MLLLTVMIYVHHFFDKTDSNCLAPVANKWPRDGVLRVEVITNLEKFNAYQDRLLEESYEKQNDKTNTTVFDLKRILREGPSALPKELRSKSRRNSRKKSDHWTNFLTSEYTLFNVFAKSDSKSKKMSSETSDYDESDDHDSHDLLDDSDASFEYVVEYSLHYGLLKLSHSYRLEHHIPFLLVRLDPETDSCFGDSLSRALMKYFIGYEDVLMTSVKALAENETDKGYLRDMITGEHYRFVTMGSPRASYFTALVVMLIFVSAFPSFALCLDISKTHCYISFYVLPFLQMLKQIS